MSIFKNVRLRVAAKSLKDVDIPDSTWKADFDIVDRYQCLGNELMRIGLLGLAGFGFLIKEILPKGRPLTSTCSNFMLLASLLIVFCIVLILFHRFKSTNCLYCQILIMRSLKRLENSHWNEIEIEKEKDFIEKTRKIQRRVSMAAHCSLIIAAIFFAVGLLLIMLVFHNALAGNYGINTLSE